MGDSTVWSQIHEESWASQARCVGTYTNAYREREAQQGRQSHCACVAPSMTSGRVYVFCWNQPLTLTNLFFSLLVPCFFQKPWVYDLWEVWNDYPRQVSPFWYGPPFLRLRRPSNCPELGPSPLPTLCPCLCSPLALSLPELTHPYSLFTYLLCRSSSLCNYIFEFKSLSYDLFSICNSWCISFYCTLFLLFYRTIKFFKKLLFHFSLYISSSVRHPLVLLVIILEIIVCIFELLGLIKISALTSFQSLKSH